MLLHDLVTAPSIDWRDVRVPGTSSREPLIAPNPVNAGNIDPLVLREVILSDSYQRSLIRERNPPLSEALESGDPQRFVAVFTEQKKRKDEHDALRRRMIQSDPMDIEAQQKIAEEIQQANINSNMETAMEFSPESFGQVIMLYINCLVNGQPVKAFVDSGAQMTIMSVACANRCNIMRLVDRRWAGLAKGVGTQKIIGRVHVAQIQIENDFLASSFSVLESQPMDMLLGLDMLKRHQVTMILILFIVFAKMAHTVILVHSSFHDFYASCMVLCTRVKLCLWCYSEFISTRGKLRNLP